MTSRITLITTMDSQLCDHARAVLARVAADHPLQVDEIRLDSAAGQVFATRIGMLFAPVILLDGQPFAYGRLSERRLRKALARRRP